jgi:hypothetical protein
MSLKEPIQMEDGTSGKLLMTTGLATQTSIMRSTDSMAMQDHMKSTRAPTTNTDQPGIIIGPMVLAFGSLLRKRLMIMEIPGTDGSQTLNATLNTAIVTTVKSLPVVILPYNKRKLPKLLPQSEHFLYKRTHLLHI